MTQTHEAARSSETPAWVRGLAFLLVAASCSQLAYALHPRKGPFIGYLELAAVGALGAWGLWVLSTGRLRVLRWPPWPIWAFMAVAVLSLGGATSPRASVVEIVQYALYLIGLYVLFLDAGRGGLDWLGPAACVAVALATAAALAQLAGGREPMQVAGLTMDRNVHSAFLAFLLPLVWAWGCRWWPRPAGVAIAVLVTAALVTMLGPPHVWIAVAAIAWVSAVLLERRQWSAAAAVVGLAILVNFASPVHRGCNVDELVNPWETGDVYKLLREVGASEDQPLMKKRWLEWWPALAMIADNPLVGVGAGNYQLNVGQPEFWGYLPNAKKTEPNTNNLYLVVGGSMGLAGLAALMAVFITFIRLAAAGARDRDPLMVGVAASLVALAVASVFTALLVRGAAVAWVALMAAAASRAAAPAPAPASQTGREQAG